MSLSPMSQCFSCSRSSPFGTYYFDWKRKFHETPTDYSSDAIERPLRRCCHRQGNSDWSKIGADLLECIQKKLSLPDILRCRSVCSSWRSITKTHLSSPLNYPPITSLPLIIWRKVPDDAEEDDDEEDDGDTEEPDAPTPDDEGRWYFMDVLSKDGGGNLYLPNQKSKQLLAIMGECVGHSHGYFMFLDKEDDDDIYLFHPTLFSGSLLRFPPIHFSKRIRNRVGRIEKALLWGDPVSGNYGIALIHEGSSQLLFAKCGGTGFTPLELQGHMGRNDAFVDIICTKNNYIYGITDGLYRSNHYIKAWDCSDGTIKDHGVPKNVLSFKPKFSSGSDDPTGVMSMINLRLVESQGEILLVAIHRPQSRLIKAEGGLHEYNKVEPLCQVYKMDFKLKEWVRMSSLRDRVLFVMEFQSMSLSTHEFPQYQRNSIYFCHFFVTSRSNANYLGIFNMEDGSIKLIDAKQKCKKVY